MRVDARGSALHRLARPGRLGAVLPACAHWPSNPRFLFGFTRPRAAARCRARRADRAAGDGAFDPAPDGGDAEPEAPAAEHGMQRRLSPLRIPHERVAAAQRHDRRDILRPISAKCVEPVHDLDREHAGAYTETHAPTAPHACDRAGRCRHRGRQRLRVCAGGRRRGPRRCGAPRAPWAWRRSRVGGGLRPPRLRWRLRRGRGC